MSGELLLKEEVSQILEVGKIRYLQRAGVTSTHSTSPFQCTLLGTVHWWCIQTQFNKWMFSCSCITGRNHLYLTERASVPGWLVEFRTINEPRGSLIRTDIANSLKRKHRMKCIKTRFRVVFTILMIVWYLFPYICCGDSFGEICHREKHGGLIRGDDPQLKIIWSIITWVALISSDQPQSFIFVGTRIQQQLGIMMMMITIFIICLMLSVSCDWCKQTPWKILLISSNRHQIDLLLKMPKKVSPSERIKSFPEAPRCTCVSWGDCFPYNSILFTTQCDSMLFTQFDDFHTIRWFWRNSMLSTEFNAGSTGARALLWHQPTKGSAFLIVVIFHLLPRIIPNCVTLQIATV